ncbi:MAG TPA: ATP-binding protein [Myxococcota bacterium]|nr:ATP-binding protein [Myxococcota bacterium]
MAVADADFARWLVASLGSGLVAVDRAGRVVACSAEARPLVAPVADPGDALGRPCAELLARHPSLVRSLLEAAGGREAPGRAELALEGPERRRIGFRVLTVRDDAGRPAGAALLFRDLTPFERMDEQERLRERLAALGEMTAQLVHELRNPLSVMEILAGLLERRVHERPEERRLTEELLDEVRRLAGTLTASLEFVKPLPLARSSLDPRELCEEALSLALSRVPFAGSLERDFPDALPRLVADRGSLRAALVDLLVNALEALRDAPVRAAVRLRMGVRAVATGEDGGRDLVFEVADSGPGVPPELAERIFYPFFTTKPQGSGIGLAHARKVALQHGGSLELGTPPGGGATFRLRLPEAGA